MNNENTWLVHGCDGCCYDNAWQEESLRESVRIANEIIVDHKKAIAGLKEKYKERL